MIAILVHWRSRSVTRVMLVEMFEISSVSILPMLCITAVNITLSALAKAVKGLSSPEQRDFVAARAIQLYQHMARIGGSISPDTTTFLNLISVLDETGYDAQIIALHDLMKTSNVVPDSTTSTMIMKASLKIGQYVRGANMAALLMTQGSKVEASAVTALLGACVNSGEWNAALQLSAAAQSSQGMAAGTAMYNYVLQGALNAHQYEIASQILTHMGSLGIQVEKNISEKLLDGSQRLDVGSGPVLQAQSLRSFETEREREKVSEPLNLENGAASQYPFDGSSSSSVALNIEDMVSKLVLNHQESAQPRTPILDSSPGAQLSPESDTMVGPSDSVLPRSSSSNAMSKTGVEVSQEGAELHRQMSTDQTKKTLTVDDINEMLSTLSDEKNATACLEVINHMKIAGILPNTSSYHYVIRALAASGDFEKALHICREGHSSGALSHFALPDSISDDSKKLDSTQYTILDLTGCEGPEEALVMTVTWLLLVRQLASKGLPLLDNMTITMREKVPSSNETSPTMHKISGSSLVDGSGIVWSEVQHLLTGGKCCLEDVKKYMPFEISVHNLCCSRDDDVGKFTLKFATCLIFPGKGLSPTGSV